MTAKWTPPDMDDFIRRYLSGESRKKLACAYGVTDKVIKRILIEQGIALRDDSIRLDMDEPLIVASYQSGKSENSIADDFNISRNVVRRILLQNNVAVRDCVEANRLMMQQRTTEQNIQNVQSAQRARRGSKDTIETMMRRAQTRQRKQTHVSPYELLFKEWLEKRGIESIPQQAIGTYNVDLGAFPVAVEIFGGSWHSYADHAARAPERFRYLLDSGWNVVIVWVDRVKYGISIDCADYIAAFVKQSRSNPSLRGQYRVIWSDGKEVPTDRLDINNLSLVPSRR